ncbi:ABC transporter ATP-binding protein [Cellulomonas gilvus]|uniref:ABC transporter related protein n=1 Tax=Cellulomonas gilvus (strain ATCC 13127 / NRRL B-14078) TaxID=593907 RepID=F8A3H0_CELGA|nr:ABC transporter ATP-binding protein [Cellulomonas gilvus]AEI10734.1 ABC transporter related protein [Cellulomonas gilvus ATCC 13127]
MTVVPAGTGAAPAGRPLLRASGLARAFGDERALDGVDLSVRAGEIHALVGLNGAGKSTLMRLALGMLRPGAGTVAVRHPDGRMLPPWRAPKELWAGVGHLVETPSAYPELTVVQAVICAARLRGLEPSAAAAAAADVVDRLALTHWAGRRAGVLSLGNRQRLGLACASVHRPGLLVLDEPTNALDPSGVVVVRRWLREARDAGAGVLVSSHHLDEVARTADRISVLHHGRVIGGLPPGGVDLERQFFAMVYAVDQAEGRA